MDRSMMMIDALRDRRTFAPEGDGTGTQTTTTDDAAAAVATAAAAAAAATTTQTQTTTGKWWEGDRFAEPARQFLNAKGLTVDDPLEATSKLVDIASSFEKRIGKGLDTILDKPAKDQPYSDWVAKNREALGLPADEAAYKVARPETWPKEAKWDDAGEAKLRSIGVKYGIPADAVQEIVNFQAETALASYTEAGQMGETAKKALMADLERDYGDQTPKVIHQARLGAQFIGEKAGLDAEAIANLSDVLTEKTGDANAIRAFRVIGEMLGDDVALGIGKSGGLTTTPAEARAQIASLRAPTGEYGKAVAANDRAEINRLQPTIDRLTKLAAG